MTHGAPGGCEECRAIARAAGEPPEAAEHICLVRAEADAHAGATRRDRAAAMAEAQADVRAQVRAEQKAGTRRRAAQRATGTAAAGGGVLWWSDAAEPDAAADAADAADLADMADAADLADVDFDF